MKSRKFHTDHIVKATFWNLKNDMCASLGIEEEDLHSIFGEWWANTPTAELREKSFLLSEGMPPYTYKWCAQVNGFLKRYTFQDDQITPAAREDITNAKFIKLQEALAASYSRPRSMRCHEVIRLTRKIVRRILSETSLETLNSKGRFGTKATVGCPANDAFIDQKLIEHPITGSAAHVEWLKNVVFPADPMLETIVSRNKIGIQTVQHLAQVNVPKKYNIDRGINPNALIGTLYTDTIGKLIVSALRNEGLDIRKLQVTHGILAKKASLMDPMKRSKFDLATADLSDASHGFLSHLLNALLPRKWYRAVMCGVIRQVEVAGKVHRMESVMTMGIGFTFPMQTLLFYALLKSISILTGVRGIISVYGDDLIYPVKMHRFVVGIFRDLGFKLNLDKTFVNSNFKESCGSDYFHGVNVRPYSVKAVGSALGRREYAAFCYKMVNGLLYRWNYAEITNSVDFILREIEELMGSIYLVEESQPVTAGLRTSNWIPPTHPDYAQFRYAPWVFVPDLWSYVYPHLTPVISRHYVSHYLPYYWDQLRQIHEREFSWECVLQLPEVMGTALFRWHRTKRIYRKCALTKVRKERCRAYVSAKNDEDNDVARYEVLTSMMQLHRMKYPS